MAEWLSLSTVVTPSSMDSGKLCWPLNSTIKNCLSNILTWICIHFSFHLLWIYEEFRQIIIFWNTERTICKPLGIDSSNWFEINTRLFIRFEPEVKQKFIQLLEMEIDSERVNRVTNDTFCATSAQILCGKRTVTVVMPIQRNFENKKR